MPKYLFRRGDGRSSNYVVRLVAPTAVQPFLPKKDHVFRKSTGTADLGRAKVVGAEIIASKLREWHSLRELMLEKRPAVSTALSEQLIQQIVGSRLQSWLYTDNKERLGETGLDEEHLAEIEEFCRYSDGVMRSILSQGRASRAWDGIVEEVTDWCHVLGYDIELTDPNFPLLMRAYAQAERRAQQFISSRNRGEDPVQNELAPKNGTRLSAMNDEFIRYKTPLAGPKSVSMTISIWNKFIAFNGDTFLDEVTSHDIYRFFEAQLFTAEKKWSQGYVDGHGKRALKEMFALARTKAFMESANPVNNVEIMPRLSEDERNQRLRPRFSFSSQQINALFSSEWYKPHATTFTGKLGDDLAARYFGPLIGLLHGTRVREFLQLMTSDILKADGVLCFKFQTELKKSDERDKQFTKERQGKPGTSLPKRTLKTRSVLRTIPIHPKLIELGFEDYVAARRNSSGMDVPLFESSVPEPGGKSPMWGRAFEQSFLRYVRDKLAFGSGFGSHSFRHQFEDRIRNSQARGGIWPAGLGQLLSGRKLPRDKDREFFRLTGSEDRYGNGYLPSAALPFMEKLIFDDIEFPIAFRDWLQQK